MSLKKNPGWKLELETIELVQEAREKMGLKSNADVVSAWATAWKEKKECPITTSIGQPVVDVPILGPGQTVTINNSERPVAGRVETPYQRERRERLEALRAKMEGGNNPVPQLSGADAPVMPFEVEIQGEKHEVVSFKGRAVLVWIGPSSKVMKKNLTPQELVIYWQQRVRS